MEQQDVEMTHLTTIKCPNEMKSVIVISDANERIEIYSSQSDKKSTMKRLCKIINALDNWYADAS